MGKGLLIRPCDSEGCQTVHRERSNLQIRCIFERVVTDNAQNFNEKMIADLYTKWKIKHSNSSLYKPKMNGVIEATNKNIKKIVQKMVITYKDWHEWLPYALHAY